MAGDEDLAMACAHRRRAGANMVWVAAIEVGESFGNRECEVAMFSPTLRLSQSSRLIRDFLLNFSLVDARTSQLPSLIFSVSAPI
jgi:hypothetical protein